jgi:hypothetical protein
MPENTELEYLEEGAGDVSTPQKEKLRRVAKYQRAVIFAVLVNVILNVVFGATREASPAVWLILMALALVVVGISMASIALLANELYGVGRAVLCGLLVVVPCVGIITLLIVNQSATRFLQAQGIKVGFMGVKPEQIQ